MTVSFMNNLGGAILSVDFLPFSRQHGESLCMRTQCTVHVCKISLPLQLHVHAEWNNLAFFQSENVRRISPMQVAWF